MTRLIVNVRCGTAKQNKKDRTTPLEFLMVLLITTLVHCQIQVVTLQKDELEACIIFTFIFVWLDESWDYTIQLRLVISQKNKWSSNIKIIREKQW